MLRLATTLLTVVLVFSGGHLVTGPLAFEDRAARAVWTWRTSGAAEIWHEGFVPIEGLAAIPPKARRRIQQDEEYGWVVAGPLPETPPEALVRWDDGVTMRVPVIDAREALQALSPWPEEYTFPDDRAYHLTGATFTSMRLKTLRGMATVPAWRLHFADLPGPIDHVAVDQKAVGTIRDAVGHNLIGDVMNVEVLDGGTLLASYEYGTCAGRPHDVSLRAREEPDVVILGIDIERSRGGICAGVGRTGRGVIKLDEPLGTRVVLDAKSRLPVLCRRVLSACHAENG